MGGGQQEGVTARVDLSWVGETCTRSVVVVEEKTRREQEGTDGDMKNGFLGKCYNPAIPRPIQQLSTIRAVYGKDIDGP